MKTTDKMRIFKVEHMRGVVIAASTFLFLAFLFLSFLAAAVIIR